MTDFDREIAVRTVWMEARGEGSDGMRAVASVLANRLADGRWGANLVAVCLAPLQFSCWNSSDPNRVAMARLADDDALLFEARQLVELALSGRDDPTDGATHYYADTMTRPPDWTAAARFTVQIGHHRFHKNVP